MNMHCTHLTTVASNIISSLLKETFKRKAKLPRIPVPKARKDASQIRHSSANNEVTTPGREISHEQVPDLFRKSSSLPLKSENQGRSLKVSNYRNA